MPDFDFSSPELQIFFLIFLRVSAIIATAPLFDNRSIPIIFKAGLALSVSILLLPILDIDAVIFPSQITPFAIGVASEIMLGLIIGFSVKLIFSGIQLAGQFAGFQMGFAIVNVMDPMTSTQAPVISQFKYQIAMLIFLSINAHHWFLKAIVDSFRLVAPLSFQLNGSLVEHLMKISGNMFVIAVKVAAPIIAALLLTTVALGMIARTVPQMNIFIVAMPLKIIIGLIFFCITLPYLSMFFVNLFKGLGNNIFLILELAG
ncbi:flagellar biosynthetic protein FliR [Thermodesulfobacteriota bacterium]